MAVAGRTITGSAVVHLADRSVLHLTWACQGGHLRHHLTKSGLSLDHPDQMFATTVHSHKEAVSVGDSMAAFFRLFPMIVGQILVEQMQDHAKVHLYMQNLFVEESDLAEAKVVEKQQAFAE